MLGISKKAVADLVTVRSGGNSSVILHNRIARASDSSARLLARSRSSSSARGAIYLAVILGFTLSTLSFWPGFMEADGFDQYAQAIGLKSLNDWHPVILALLWKLVISIHDGPQLMLLLQMSLYWAGFLYLALQILRRTDRDVLAIGAVVVPYFPFLLNFAGVLWKDTQLALAFFWASLLISFARPLLVNAGLSLSLVFYGLAVRHNGVAAVPPLLFMWSCKFGGVVGLQHRFAPPLISVCGAVVLMLLNFALAELVGAKTTHPLHSQMLNEIAYIECRSAASFDVVRSYYGDALEGVNELNKRDRVCGETTTLALTDDTNYIFEKRLLKEPNNDDSTVYPSWLKTVGSSPLAYLRYRIIVYRTFLRTFGYLDPYNSFYDGRDPNPYPDKVSSEPANPLGLTDLLSHYMDFASERLDPFFRPIFWLSALLITACVAIGRRNLAATLVCFSGISYLAAYLFALPAPDFRYAYWAIFAQVLSTFLLLSNSAALSEQPPNRGVSECGPSPRNPSSLRQRLSRVGLAH
jgi:hypothetical protein